LTLILLIRLIDLQIVHHRFYRERAQEQRRRVINLAADRGDITDRQGHLLASSLDTYSLYVNPREFTSNEVLSKLLGEPTGPFDKRKLFAWVKRKVGEDLYKKITAAQVPGVYFLKETRRVYPKAHLASQVLGFVGLDNEGLSGVELAYEKYLKGKEGRIVTESDPGGFELLAVRDKSIEDASPGMVLTLTIDETIQYIAEREIQKAIQAYSAQAGAVIVMEIETGEILALAGKPDFDPNEYTKFNPKTWKTRALDVYEPGSTFKVITCAAGLEEGVIDIETRLKPLDSVKIADKTIENSHPIKWDKPYLSISKMLEQSINTGAVQIALKLGPERLYRNLKKFGFGGSTTVGLWGESRGLLYPWQKWNKPDIGMISFGQTIAVTPLQLISAIGSIANQGKRVKPILVKKIESVDGSFVKTFAPEEAGRTVSEKTAREMIRLMENVVLYGSGRKARLSNYRTAGKTGTAQKAIPGRRGYLKDRYVASFIGFAPLKDPRLVTLVIVDDPKGVIWGETVAGPTFKAIMEESLRYLNVPPDIGYN
jgi:stage V sporulation protein D (sporulation-specific penicillin-binding protein)